MSIFISTIDRLSEPYTMVILEFLSLILILTLSGSFTFDGLRCWYALLIDVECRNLRSRVVSDPLADLPIDVSLDELMLTFLLTLLMEGSLTSLLRGVWYL